MAQTALRARRRLRVRTAWQVAALALVAGLAGTVATSASATVRIVSQTKTGTNYYSTIQGAVNAAKPNDWVLIEPGKTPYYESVRVQTEGLHIRGMNRNTVILDGKNEVVPGGVNGIEVYKTNNVWIENLTVRNFDREEPNGANGNEIWWNGGDGSGKVGAHGWWGSYLTAYDTGLDGGYGIFTDNETEGSWDHVYASGFNDSGMYLGACQECDAKISTVTMENNALGYSGSNSGGKLIIEKSLIRNNTAGIVPNSENPGDGPPPQDGECGRPNIENPNPEPTITSTKVKRCTIIRNNTITENNNLTVPVNNSTGPAPWGTGVVLPGDYADQVSGNTITNNANDGVLGFEYANPFTPNFEHPELGFEGTLFFMFTGNKIAENTFTNNGYRGGWPFTGDIAMMGGFSELFPGSRYEEHPSHSVNDCAIGNTIADATFPANIEGTWGCQHSQTPSPGGGFEAVEYLVTLPAEAPSPGERKGQVAPGPQPTMPNACKAVPVNPLCP